MVLDWIDVTIQALQNLWQGFLSFIPVLLGAVIVFIIGWFFSVGVGKLVAEVLKKLKLNQIFEKGAWKNALEKAEIKVDASAFVGAVVKWILIVVFLLAAVEILGLVQFAIFLKGVLNYLPNVIVAVLIFVVTVIVVDIVEKIVRAAVEGIKVGSGQIVSAVVKWSIWVFAILAILTQLRFEAADWIFELIKMVFMGIVLIAVVAFGLGGKDMATEILQDLRKKLKG
ncbi:MAG TPA: hypothetical protein VMW21_01125 [Patescibacteria group bacterium]|nr:hypothetical protein [Patescibacteria group bacterium]